jgi:hypothetical protein
MAGGALKIQIYIYIPLFLGKFCHFDPIYTSTFPETTLLPPMEPDGCPSSSTLSKSHSLKVAKPWGGYVATLKWI